jgi:small GTP-binding protein
MTRILKIVITGPFNAGKTQFIKTASEIKVASTERRLSTADERKIKKQTTVAMDYGRVTIDDDTLQLFGTPGQDRFDFMWEILAQEMHGFIVIVDSTDQSSLPEAKRLIKLFSKFDKVPYLVAANKQDQKNALKPNDIHQLLGLPAKILVVPVISTDRRSARKALIEMAEMIK